MLERRDVVNDCRCVDDRVSFVSFLTPPRESFIIKPFEESLEVDK